jgi:hypothetical protein
MIRREDNSTKYTAGEFVGSAVIGLVAAHFTLPVIRWMVPSNPEYLSWKCAIAAVCAGLYIECIIVLAKAKKKNASARKLLLIGSLVVYFAALVGGEFAGILWISEAIPRPELDVLLIVVLLFVISVFLLVVAGIQRRRNSS